MIERASFHASRRLLRLSENAPLPFDGLTALSETEGRRSEGSTREGGDGSIRRGKTVEARIYVDCMIKGASV
jgi:hypothetical protein